jgi:hypothetical protein
MRDRLQHGGLACLGRGDDEAALSLADRGDKVDDPRRGGGVAVFEAKPLVGVDGGELVEVTTGAGLVRRQAVDRGDVGQAGFPRPLSAPGTAATGAATGAAIAVALTASGGLATVVARAAGVGVGVAGENAVDLVALAQSVGTDLAGRERKVGRGPPVPGRPQVAAPVGEIDDAGDQRDRS